MDVVGLFGLDQRNERPMVMGAQTRWGEAKVAESGSCYSGVSDFE